MSARKEVLHEHVVPPEHFVFLSVARTAMMAYHETHGRFPATWTELGMRYADSPYSTSDPTVYPRADERYRWQPRGCRLCYEIVESGEMDFVIRALDGEEPRYEITEKDERPRALQPEDSDAAPEA